MRQRLERKRHVRGVGEGGHSRGAQSIGKCFRYSRSSTGAENARQRRTFSIMGKRITFLRQPEDVTTRITPKTTAICALNFFLMAYAAGTFPPRFWHSTDAGYCQQLKRYDPGDQLGGGLVICDHVDELLRRSRECRAYSNDTADRRRTPIRRRFRGCNTNRLTVSPSKFKVWSHAKASHRRCRVRGLYCNCRTSTILR
jgi:hypothetical protein